MYWCSWPQFHQALWPAFPARFPLHLGGDIGQRGLCRVDRFSGVFLLLVGVAAGQAGGCDGLVDSEGALGCGVGRFKDFLAGLESVDAPLQLLGNRNQPVPGFDDGRQQLLQISGLLRHNGQAACGLCCLLRPARVRRLTVPVFHLLCDLMI